MNNSSISLESIDRLLDKLASDDQFRSLMQSDPKTALHSLGIAASDSPLPMPCSLPSKEQIQSQRAELQAKLDDQGRCGYFPFAIFGESSQP